MEGGEVADGPQSLHSLRSWYFSLNTCFSSCQSVINWRTSLNKEVCWKKLKLKQNELSFFSVLYIWSPYSIEVNWQHINNNVYYEKGQERSIRIIHRKKAITRKPRKWKSQRLRAAAAFESLENTSGNVEIAFGLEFAYYNFCFDHHFL